MHQVDHLGYGGIADAIGVTRHAVHKWRERHPSGSDHPFPEPDVLVDGTPGWRPDRVAEIVRWREGLPGRGSGGGRPPASRRAYLRAADDRGLTRDEAVRTLNTFVDEFPEMSEGEVCAWLVEEWRGWGEPAPAGVARLADRRPGAPA